MLKTGGREGSSVRSSSPDSGDEAAAAPDVEGNDECRPGSLGELASLLELVEDLVVEDGEVERQTEANWMRGLHLVFF